MIETASTAVVEAVPSETVTVNVSEVSVVRALIAARFGVKTYAPVARVTVSVPYVPVLVTVAAGVTPWMP